MPLLIFKMRLLQDNRKCFLLYRVKKFIYIFCYNYITCDGGMIMQLHFTLLFFSPISLQYAHIVCQNDTNVLYFLLVNFLQCSTSLEEK